MLMPAMLPNHKLRRIAIVCVAVGIIACDSDRDVFTLYRNSVLNENARIHVATFDAHEKEGYNRENCQQAQVLFQAQPGVLTRFWCEKGRFKE